MSNPDLSPIQKPAWLGKVTKSTVSSSDLDKAKAIMKEDPSHEKNGWTPEKLALYFRERETAQAGKVFHQGPKKPKKTNGLHNGHRWRR